MKKFNNWRRADGFTLVELIVVIAILAILGGVAVPAYSGYVEKANEAADQALLAEVNTAFAAACAINGENHIGIKATATLDDARRVIRVNPNNDGFQTFFDSKDAAFKTVNGLYYNSEVGMFEFGISFGGITVSKDAVNTFWKGALGELGAAELLDMVTDLTEKLGADAEEGGFGSGALPAALASDAYQTAALELLGVTDMTYDKYMQAKYDAVYEQYKQDNGFVEGGDPKKNAQILEDAKTEATKQREAMEKNMLILVGASKAEEASGNILTVLQSGNAYDTIRDNVYGTGESDSAMGTAQSALAYSLYVSYCQRNEGKDPTSAGFLAALSGIDSDFTDYLDTNEAKTDLEGAKAAMGMIGNQSPDILENTAVNGLGNQELEDALTQILGK